MVDEQGNIITKHEDMADLLKNHWSQVFSHKDTSKANTGFAGLARHLSTGKPCKNL